MKSITQKIVPFIFLGVMLVILTFGIILLSYVLILGAIVGFVLYVVARIKEKFFPSKHIIKTDNSNKSGRTFEHDDK
jgi:uncharacterized membrane protein SpoIIM required for sporulation